MLSLLAILATSAVASASASAAECPDTIKGGDYAVCVRSSPTATPKEYEGTLEGTSGTSVLTATVLGVKVKITCTSDKFLDTAEDSGFSKGSITFENCSVTEPKNCKLPTAQKEKIVANFTNQLATPPASPRGVTFTGSGAGEEFTSITLENNGTNCAIANTYKITGNTGTGCTFDAEIETFKPTALSPAEHELTCVATGEALKLGGNTASFTSTAKVKTSTKEEFAILES
jgi:hypothetical protein